MKDERPDIAFEVVLTSGGLDKLAVYEGLGVPEVWFWKAKRFEILRFGPAGYERRDRSDFLPGLDFTVLAEFVGAQHQAQAVRAYRDRLRQER
jgi:Uma2 family endonuclease